MSRISILDCTLRDGGYINKWNFGEKAVSDIIRLLNDANIEIIECGFLRDIEYDQNKTVYSDIKQITSFITPKKPNSLYVGMIALGDISPSKIAPYDGSSIDGICLTFHKHEWNEAREVAKELIEKGYKVFIQPVGTTSYTDNELLNLIADVNTIHPFAFYLVDTLGTMYRHDVLRFFYCIDHNLNNDIWLGFHSHNNFQSSFANAQEIMLQGSKRHIIIDASVYGMGRGAGNLPTELLTEYINSNLEHRYSILPLLAIADQYLMNIFAENPWGYSLPYFLSAKERCHPNYATYLMNKQTLDIESISKLLSLLPRDQSDLFHRDLVENYYNSFQDYQIDDTETRSAITNKIFGRSALILGPGASLKKRWERLLKDVSEYNPFIVSVNYVPDKVPIDALFISNQKRLGVLKSVIQNAPYVIATSNLRHEISEEVHFVNYMDFLGEGHVGDNAGAMLVRLLRKSGVKKIYFAGFDGFCAGPTENYCISSYQRILNKTESDWKNADISRQLRLALGNLPYQFLTPTRYDL